MQKTTLGIDMGGTKIALGLFDESGKLLFKSRFPTDLSLSAAELMDAIFHNARALLSRAGDPALAGVGIGTPSSVDVERGFVRFTTNIPHWKNAPVRDYLEDLFSCPVVVDNDANAAALAEYHRGAGRGSSNMVYCAVSTGIGGGLILGGKLFHGDHNYAGEIGHMVVTPDEGVLCGCGNRGCFESYCSGANIWKHVAARAKNGETTAMLSMVSRVEEIDGRVLNQAFLHGDQMATALLDQIGSYLGLMCYNLYQALNIDCFVLGGGLCLIGLPLFARIERAFARFSHQDEQPSFFPAALKEDFGIIGAMLLAV